jgi:hypothetical protein
MNKYIDAYAAQLKEEVIETAAKTTAKETP